MRRLHATAQELLVTYVCPVLDNEVTMTVDLNSVYHDAYSSCDCCGTQVDTVATVTCRCGQTHDVEVSF